MTSAMDDGTEKKDESKVRAALARSAALSPEQRQAIGKKGAAARWRGRPVRASHKGNFKADFGFDVDCFVLDDAQKTAVISQRGLGAALGLGDKGKDLPRFLRGQRVAPHVGGELAEKLDNPLIFQWFPRGGEKGLTLTGYGYDVTILIDLCKTIVAAAATGKMLRSQAGVVRQAHVILNASAKAGIKGLVYALAGYDQTKEEVIAAFKFYVREEAREYEKEFPDQLYNEWYRLYGLPKPQRNKPWKFMHLTVDQVYVPLARSNGKVLELTRVKKAESGERWRRLHQFLSDIGVKTLRTHLGQLLGIAQVSEDRTAYERNFAKVFGRQLPLPGVNGST